MKFKEKMQILDEKGLRRIIARMAHEIIERNRGAGNLVLVGMQTRGVVLARRIARTLQSLEKVKLKVGVLDTTLYRDDYRLPFRQPAVQATSIPFSITGKNVVLVDDVLYTGRTVRAALDALVDLGRPRAIQLAVLLDRGLREFPIHADYVGKSYKTSPKEEVRVRVKEIDKKDGVWLVEIKK
jgi:pyrimidine operon attenuation protein/uracil phosphoribosyltransferase